MCCLKMQERIHKAATRNTRHTPGRVLLHLGIGGRVQTLSQQPSHTCAMHMTLSFSQRAVAHPSAPTSHNPRAHTTRLWLMFCRKNTCTRSLCRAHPSSLHCASTCSVICLVSCGVWQRDMRGPPFTWHLPTAHLCSLGGMVRFSSHMMLQCRLQNGFHTALSKNILLQPCDVQ